MSTPSIPVVSVLVTTRNNAATIDACLGSVRSQTHPAVELIVVDNGSTDGTADLARSYTPMVVDHGPERCAQRNLGSAMATGEYLLVVDSDMVLDPGVVAACVAAADGEHRAVIVPEESFGTGFWSRCKALERSFYVGVDWIEAPRFVHADLFRTVGGYDEEMVGGEDWDLTVRLRRHTAIARVDTMIRHDEGHLTLREIVRSRRYYARGFSRYFGKEEVKGGARSGAAQAAGVFGLFLRQPRRLAAAPATGAGMLAMKAVEYATVGQAVLAQRFAARTPADAMAAGSA